MWLSTRNAFGSLQDLRATGCGSGSLNLGLGFTGASTPNTGGGFTYLRNRWYDPQTGRFLSQDPIGLAGGVNLYAYAGNDPVAYTDPFGLCPCVVAAYVAFELLSAAYDVYETSQAFQRSPEEGAQALHATIVGAIAPGPGSAYRKAAGAIDDAASALRAPDGGGFGGSSPTFLAPSSGPAIPVPAGATGPTPTKAPGAQFTGGSGGPGLDPRVTGVRVMDANKHQGRRAVYMNEKGQTVSPRTGRTVPNDHPEAHHYF